MAYDRKRVLVFGVGGVIIAALLIIAFLPVREEIGISPVVALQGIPGYGFQVVRMSEGQSSVVHLNATFDSFEIRRADGTWIDLRVSGGEVSFDLIRSRETSFATEAGSLEAGGYTAIRFRVARGLELTNATLDSGEVVVVDVPSFQIELGTEFEVGEDTERLQLSLRTGSGVLSEYMLRELHVSLGTMKVEVDVATSP